MSLSGFEAPVQKTRVAGIRDNNVAARRGSVRYAKPDENRQTGLVAQRQSERAERHKFFASNTAMRVP